MTTDQSDSTHNATNMDFSNDKAVLASREHLQMISNSIKIVSEALSLEPADYTGIESFMIFNTLKSPNISDAFKSTANDFDIEVFLVEHIWYVNAGRQQTGNAECFLGLLSLKQEYPHTCIFKETLREKITDWFLKRDVDFEYQKRFSNQFHVVSHDKEKLHMLLQNKPLDEFIQFPDMEIEIKGNFCLFKVSAEPLSEEDAKSFVVLARELHKMLN